jgi:lipid-A-disaccharide synthase-like uncharacterized protein
MMQRLKSSPTRGRVAVPMLMWFAGVPLGLVLVVWFIFFRG